MVLFHVKQGGALNKQFNNLGVFGVKIVWRCKKNNEKRQSNACAVVAQA